MQTIKKKYATSLHLSFRFVMYWRNKVSHISELSVMAVDRSKTTLTDRQK